jgi:hypothetical protein
VLDYFEFEAHDALTDAAFRAQLDGAEPPPAPAWLGEG